MYSLSLLQNNPHTIHKINRIASQLLQHLFHSIFLSHRAIQTSPFFPSALFLSIPPHCHRLQDTNHNEHTSPPVSLHFIIKIKTLGIGHHDHRSAPKTSPPINRRSTSYIRFGTFSYRSWILTSICFRDASFKDWIHGCFGCISPCHSPKYVPINRPHNVFGKTAELSLIIHELHTEIPPEWSDFQSVGD